MAKAKSKRNKPYKPKKSYRFKAFGVTILPHELAQMRSLNRPLNDEEIETFQRPFSDFIDSLKQGAATEEGFQLMIDTGYNLLELIALFIEKDSLSEDKDDDFVIRMELVRIKKDVMNALFHTVERIRTRHKATGKFGASYEDIESLQKMEKHWKMLLGITDYSDWFESYRRSQVELCKLRHRAKRSQNECKQ